MILIKISFFLFYEYTLKEEIVFWKSSIISQLDRLSCYIVG